ncbi:hypothetical protein IGS74_10780 [Aureimonas sp. OT7]|uniref:hypothetical protein n=1 Tax=Aureimonas sp. OT7 TaxID=2816454 RepID=UPI0017822B43|nr:hypothetical protein [Aureimonas sp. OT7]QOG05138.1 hypothetical protein IGS74_10780 [Aureimonas sp. OT7]
MNHSDEVSALIDRLYGKGVNSTNRLSFLLSLLHGRPTEVFWPVFLETWSRCDDTWHERRWMLFMLRQHGSAKSGNAGRSRDFMSVDGRSFFDSLPDLITIYRGCSRPRVRGLSWTTDQRVARTFARGHRGIRVPAPVIVTARIPKVAIFAVITDRDESELIIDPIRLRNLATTGIDDAN